MDYSKIFSSLVACRNVQVGRLNCGCLVVEGINVTDNLYHVIRAHDHLAAVYPVGDIGDASPQVSYLGIMVVFLSSGAFLVVHQALIRRELDKSVRSLRESVRYGKGYSEVRKSIQMIELERIH